MQHLIGNARWRRLLQLAGFVALAAIAGGMPAACVADSSGNTSGAAVADTAKPHLTTGVVRVGDNLFYVPLPEPVQGCIAYRQFSATRKVSKAAFFRATDGGFTLDRDKAVCD
jgi:hypothetical protein